MVVQYVNIIHVFQNIYLLNVMQRQLSTSHYHHFEIISFKNTTVIMFIIHIMKQKTTVRQ